MPYKLFNGRETKSLESMVVSMLESNGASPAAAYYGSAVFMRSVEVLGDALTTAPLVLRMPDGELLDSHPALDIWNESAPEYDDAQQLQTLNNWLQVYGWATVLKQRGSGGQVIGVMPLNPATMTINSGANGIDSFTQTLGAKKTVFPRDEIIYMRNIVDPQNDLGGLSALSFAMQSANNEKQMQTTLAKFWERGAIGNIIFSTPASMTPTDTQRLGNTIREWVQGIENAFRSILLTNDIKPTQLAFPLKDLVIPEMQTMILQQVSIATGVPTVLLLPDSKDLTPVKMAEHILYHNRVRPLSNKIAGALNSQWLPEFSDLWDAGARFVFDWTDHAAFTEDATEKQNRVIQLVTTGLMSKEAAAAELGVAPEQMPQAQPMPTPAPMPQPVLVDESADEQAQDETQATRAMRDLKNWRMKCHNAQKRGKALPLKFASDSIPVARANSIAAKLASATDADSIDAAFEEFSETATQPDAGLVALMGEVKAAREALARTQAAPIINIAPPSVTVNQAEMKASIIMPDAVPQPAPVVNVTTPETPAIVVNVPQQAAPIVQVDNVVNVPQQEQRSINLTVKRDNRGNVTGVSGDSEAQ